MTEILDNHLCEQLQYYEPLGGYAGPQLRFYDNWERGIFSIITPLGGLALAVDEILGHPTAMLMSELHPLNGLDMGSVEILGQQPLCLVPTGCRAGSAQATCLQIWQGSLHWQHESPAYPDLPGRRAKFT